MIKEPKPFYHFYAKRRMYTTFYKREDFKITWTTLKAMVGLMHTSYNEEDLSYTEVRAEHKEDPSLDEHSY